MITKRILLGLMIITTATFSFVYAASQQYLIAALAFGAGLIWLKLETDAGETYATMFFLFFLALAILGSIGDLPAPIMLFGLSIDLAAWDLSRFRARAIRAGTGEIEPVLETRHLQRLFTVTGVGLLAALLPTFIKISADFVAVFILTLAVMLVLRASVRYLRHEHKSTQG